ncbi:MAG: hypothetical protein NVS4B3_25370 [Gemmatimonadaceae bacterium]
MVQLLLPMYDAGGKAFPATHYAGIRAALTERFGGFTAYSRAPAVGEWSDDRGHAQRDDIIVYEVMVEKLDHEWWRRYRAALEELFAQDELVIRALRTERL